MGQNNTQREAAARAKKNTEVQPEAVSTKPNGKSVEVQAATATPAPAPVSKQMEAIEKLKAGWQQKGVDLSKMTIKDDGKYKLVVVDTGWPTCAIGTSGGLVVRESKSYSKAYDAAMDGLALYQKQQAREQKKATAPAQPSAKAPATEKQSA